ncbi:MAG: yabG [Clostridia bacterium]|nr:yabG [Clostridia bacterium]
MSSFFIHHSLFTDIIYTIAARIKGVVFLDIKVGDLVGRKSYGCDIVFRVHDIVKKNDKLVIILKGLNLRIIADAPEADIVKLPPSKVNEDSRNYDDRAHRLMSKLQRKARHTSVFRRPAQYRANDTILICA